MNINGGNARLVLLCPAWRKHGTARTVKPGTVVLHSQADDVVPFADIEELVRNNRLPASALVEVGDDHRLAIRSHCGRWWRVRGSQAAKTWRKSYGPHHRLGRGVIGQSPVVQVSLQT